MADNKKITTGGFFRMGLRYLLGGATGEDPVTTVIKEGLKAKHADGEKTVIDTTHEETESEHGSEKAP
jgi:hypothetical protein